MGVHRVPQRGPKELGDLTADLRQVPPDSQWGGRVAAARRLKGLEDSLGQSRSPRGWSRLLARPLSWPRRKAMGLSELRSSDGDP